MITKIKKNIYQSKDFFQYTFLKVMGQGLGMVAPLVVAKIFLPELFASYLLSAMIVNLFASLFTSSTQTAFVVFANQELNNTNKINKTFSIGCIFLAISLCVFILMVFLFGGFIITFAQINYGDLIFVALAFAGISVKTFLGSLFLAMCQRQKEALVEFVFGVLNLVLVILFWRFYEINIRTIFLIYFISAVVMVPGFVRTINFNILLPLALDKKILIGIFNFSKWVFLGAIGVYLIDWGDKIVLRYFVKFEDVGIYGFGSQIFKGLVVFLSVLGVYFLPFISQHIENKQKIREYLDNKRPKILLAVAVSLIFIYFAFPAGIKIIFGDAYQGSEKIFKILLPAAFFGAYVQLYAPILNALKRYKFFQLVNIMQAIVIPLNILLIPKYGIYGAAIATASTYIGKAVVFEIYFRKQIKKMYQ